MQKSLKIIFLVLMLAIPALIFTFLKFFGDNKFDVEVFYQNGINNQMTTCDSQKENSQYFVDKKVLPLSNSNQVILFFNDITKSNIINLCRRLRDTFDDEINICVYGTNAFQSGLFNYFEVQDLNEIIKCDFVTLNNQIVLIDKKNRIRGYYSYDIDEIDRLIVEIKIILENDKRYAR